MLLNHPVVYWSPGFPASNFCPPPVRSSQLSAGPVWGSATSLLSQTGQHSSASGLSLAPCLSPKARDGGRTVPGHLWLEISVNSALASLLSKH